MQKYAIIVLSLALIATGSYAFSIETDPQAIIEKEDRKKFLNCLESLESYSGSLDSLRKEIDKCENLEIRTIGTGNLAPTTSESPLRDEVTEQEIIYSDNVELNNLHTKVCEKQINSPLCKDRKLFDRLYQITEERLPGKNFYPILLGITNAESSLGLNFAKDRIGGTCTGRNNWGGIKWRINDDGSRQKDQPIPDQYGCYLYKFESIEDYWISKVNTFRYGYKGCIDHKTPIRCISYAYVGNRYVAEESWIRNTSVFLD